MATGKILKQNGLLSENIAFSGATVAAGSYYDVNIDVEKSGYIPLGVSSWQINGTTRCALLYAGLTTPTNLRLRIINTSDAVAQSFSQGSVLVLYMSA